MKCEFCKKREAFKKGGYEFNMCEYCWNTRAEPQLMEGLEFTDEEIQQAIEDADNA